MFAKKIKKLRPLDMTRFGPRVEPFTTPTTSGFACITLHKALHKLHIWNIKQRCGAAVFLSGFGCTPLGRGRFLKKTVKVSDYDVRKN